jgi:uncharacterized protein (TIGR03066 family)
MRTVLSFALLSLLALMCAPALAQDSSPASAQTTTRPASQNDEASLRARIVGSWEEISPGKNFVDIRADGGFVLHLKKGEIGEMKQLEGTWTLDGDRTFQASMSVAGQSIVRVSTVTFDGDEMLFTDDHAQVTRHRRHSGDLPPEYRW